ncbi:hypothetical protein CE91St11_01490 [Bacteroides uniformis]|nr:hypothetical protein CE91St10_01490 [Bacteroides uniformis]GKH26975.1 hypothetical protein CE91St11_01490 [Bacteroides uniformis]
MNLENNVIMSRVFKVKPKRLKKVNGLVLTPEMEVIVTTKINMSDPFSNCAKELKEAYMRLYSFDYEKACCNRGDFDFAALD